MNKKQRSWNSINPQIYTYFSGYSHFNGEILHTFGPTFTSKDYKPITQQLNFSLNSFTKKKKKILFNLTFSFYFLNYDQRIPNLNGSIFPIIARDSHVSSTMIASFFSEDMKRIKNRPFQRFCFWISNRRNILFSNKQEKPPLQECHILQ